MSPKDQFTDNGHAEAGSLTEIPISLHGLTTTELVRHTILNDETALSSDGALVARTGKHTGRSAKDKFIVRDQITRDTVDWGEVNVPVDPDAFENLRRRMTAWLCNRWTYSQDLHAGADPDYRLKVRVITEQAWHSLFSRHLLIVPADGESGSFEPDFTILHAPGMHADPAHDGCRTETAIMIDFSRRLVLIAGTAYAGEIKKSVFSILNFILPARDVLPMHCSVNEGMDGRSAIFFGLSGTGKTTLSADSSRLLIGDDEHGWGANGVFNFEGGCYAKVIRLSQEAEPEIYAATHRFGTILENVVTDPRTGVLDLDDSSITENTRAAYPIDYISNISPSGMTGHPENVILLTADAFGVLPPVSRLTPDQATYHFLSGYTSKIPGTETGIEDRPRATFSTCFGAPFMPRAPVEYARMLADRVRAHGVRCWLVNTGWFGGKWGVGSRIPIRETRAILEAILDGRLEHAEYRKDPNFGIRVPQQCPDVAEKFLDPRRAWHDSSAYDAEARNLCGRFIDNFKAYTGRSGVPLEAAGPIGSA